MTRLSSEGREFLSKAARRSWADPAIRAKRIAGIRRAHERSYSGRKKLLVAPFRYGLMLEVSIYNELKLVAKTKRTTVAKLIRAYIEFGLFEDSQCQINQ